MTPSEKFVAELCKNSFLSFWSFPSPLGKKGKELCDLLVVCDPDVIIFSVKEIIVNDSGDYNVDAERWQRKAIDESAAQIYGGERILQLKDEVLLSDNVTKVMLPPKERRNIHRVAVAFGRGDKFSMHYGDLGKGFIHAFDERSIAIVLNELDTITDFIKFLKAKEEFCSRKIHTIAFSAEDYLAFYLDYNFEIPEGVDFLQLQDDLWEGYVGSEYYKEEKKLNERSYLWDTMIECLCSNFERHTSHNSISRHDFEESIRVMNREDRYSRRVFSDSFRAVIGEETKPSTIRARLAKTQVLGSQTYVFLKCNGNRESSIKEMQMRCLVARYIFKDCNSVIGIVCNEYSKNENYNFDLVYLDIPSWNDKLEAAGQKLQEEMGYFRNVNASAFFNG